MPRQLLKLEIKEEVCISSKQKIHCSQEAY